MKLRYRDFDAVFLHQTKDAVLLKIGEGEYWLAKTTLSYTTEQKVNHLSEGDELKCSIAEWKCRNLGI